MVTTTPLPAARPSALTTYGGPNSSSAAAASAALAQVRAGAVGIPAAGMICLANDFEPSMAAARRLGPKQAMPDARSASATPATSGASGPITTRSAPIARASAGHLPGVGDVDRVQLGERGDARDCPGAACRPVTLGIGGQRPGQRVLAAAGAEEEDSHAASLPVVAGSPAGLG